MSSSQLLRVSIFVVLAACNGAEHGGVGSGPDAGTDAAHVEDSSVQIDSTIVEDLGRDLGATALDASVAEDLGLDASSASDAGTPACEPGVFADEGPCASHWMQHAFMKAPNAEEFDEFGSDIALSGDGSTLAIAVRGEDGASTGIDGDQSSNAAEAAGAVFVYARAGDSWTLEAYVKSSNASTRDAFGRAIVLSTDGSVLAVGADNEDSNSPGVNGDQSNNDAPQSGAVYIFRRDSGAWAQEAYVKASNPSRTMEGGSFGSDGDYFGEKLALSGDGNTLAVSATCEDSDASGIGGDDTNDDLRNSGAVFVFAFDGTGWAQDAYIKASNPGELDLFGQSVALSNDGRTLAVGVPMEDSDGRGVDPVSRNEGALSSGAVYVFRRADLGWTEEAFVKASNSDAGDRFGQDVDLSADGDILIVGAPGEASAASGVGGDEEDNSVFEAGAVYLFARAGTTWFQTDYVKAAHPSANAKFGFTVSLADIPTALAVAAVNEDGSIPGIGGDETALDSIDSGAAYVFRREGADWIQNEYFKQPNISVFDAFGNALAMSADGAALVVACDGESSSGRGINPDDGSDDDATMSGAVYTYRARD